MKVSEFKLAAGNYFIAMEYYGLILNRTLLILLTDEHLIGIVANGLVSIQTPGTDPLTALITDRISIQGDLNTPLAYLNPKYLNKIADLDLLGEELLRANRANFRLRFDEISAIIHDPSKKWGMGYYPHDGKVYIAARGTKREFIILGKQSGKAIAEWLSNKSSARIAHDLAPALNTFSRIGMSFKPLTDEEFEALVSRLEILGKQQPNSYKLRVLMLALLGYGYLFLIVALLAAAVIGLGLLVASGKHLYVAIKAGLPLLFLLGVTLRALWVRLEEPTGIALTREQVPALFAALDELRNRLQGPQFHTVLLTDEFNAGVLQIPRLGIFGWQKNFLILGLPLMQTLSPEQFKAVIAHEYGHLAGAHSRFSSWIYRVRKTWMQVIKALEQREGWLVAFYTRFFRWYAPFFSAYTFVLARADEYEADRASALLSSTRHAADALLSMEIKDPLIQQHFWPAIYERTEHEPHPTLQPYRMMPQYLADPKYGESAQDRLDSAMRLTTGCANTHPSLADRLAALGESPRIPEPVTHTAAQQFLGIALPQLTDELDTSWQRNVAEWWHQRHTQIHNDKQQHAELAAKSTAGTELSLQEAWDYAVLTEEAEGAAAALPLYRVVLARAPEDSSPLLAVGRLLLDQDNPEGIALVEKAMASDKESTERACALLYHYHKRAGRDDAAEVYRQRALQSETQSEAAKAERDHLYPKDELLPHSLDEETLADLREQLQKFPRIAKAYLVRKAVQHRQEKPLYVLGVAPPWWYYSFRQGQELISKLVTDLACPGETFIIPVSGHDDTHKIAIGKRMKKMKGALIYKR